jgi:hypothetical protein
MQRDCVSRRQFVLGGVAATAGVVICGGTQSMAKAADDATGNRLGFTAVGRAYRFDTGVLRGTLRKNGRSLGLWPLEDVASGTALAGELSLFAPYRLLTPEKRFLPDGRDWTSRAKLLPDGAIEAHWLPDDAHPLELTAVYRFTAVDTLDYQATVKAQRDLRKFELFLSSYFSGFPASFACVQDADGKPAFVEATEQAGDWQMFPRDAEAAALITDGRWNYPPNPVAWKIRSRLAAPLILRRDAQRGLTAAIMAPVQDCFAVSTPFGQEGHRSAYLSLFGRDLKAGETASVRARMVIRKDLSDRQAVELYEGYRKEMQ